MLLLPQNNVLMLQYRYMHLSNGDIGPMWANTNAIYLGVSQFLRADARFADK
jgi:hypothetical protein